MVSTRKTPPAMASPLHNERRQKRMPSCSSSCATSPKRSGRRGARIITARGWLASTFSKGAQQQPFFAFHRAAADHDRPGAGSAESSERRLATIAGGSGALTSNFRLPLTCTRSAGAPMSRSREASSSVCARNRSMLRRTLFRMRPEAPVSRPRAIGNARIHHGNSGAAGVRQAQEVRPELGLREDDQPGPQS